MTNTILTKLFNPSPVASSSESSGNVTNSLKLPRTRVGLASHHLQTELVRMYWVAVRRELMHILLTLRKWQRPQYASVVLCDETDHFVHGYDTFLEQVSQATQSLADRHAENFMKRKAKNAQSGSNDPPSYEEALQDRFWDSYAGEQGAYLKSEMRMLLDKNNPPSSILYGRARMLLQAAGFLDIDKVMEYRPPETHMTFWKRPAIPQLRVTRFDEHDLPVFEPEECTVCNHHIRGAVFRKHDIVACETCYRQKYYRQRGFNKLYKHCVLPKSITPEISRKICQCTAVSRINPNGGNRALFPVDKTDEHRIAGATALRCGLLQLPNLLAEAKYSGLSMSEELYKDLGTIVAKSKAGKQLKRVSRNFKAKRDPPKTLLIDAKTFAEFDTSKVKDEADADVPLFLRPMTDKFPFGNVHMALRVGPLIIENGVQNTSGGALITTRESPQLQTIVDSSENEEQCLLLTGTIGESRVLWTQNRVKAQKRYKCMMKQVVNGAFSGVFDTEMEDSIIQDLISESQNIPDPGLPVSEEKKILNLSLDHLLTKLQQYLGSWVEQYLSSITDQLLSPETDLRWNRFTNNCQQFCDSLIDVEKFGSIIAPSSSLGSETPGPLYLMSFVCRSGGYERARVHTKYDVPNGLTEEYLLKFRYGRHDESDIIDSLQEYWYDWGAFGGPIYPYQDLFPWDCTEAYNRYPVKCGDCNISKHVLAYPFDSWSIISLHLSGGRQLYPSKTSIPCKLQTGPSRQDAARDEGSGTMSDLEWFKNRLTLLSAQSSLLTAAAAMNRCSTFRTATAWLRDPGNPELDRIKLGGIHRAQPYSHHFQKRAYHHYFVADWTHLKYDQQVAAYEQLRDSRMQQGDIERSNSDSSDCGGGGCLAYFCGVGAAVATPACAGGCQVQCGDGCGTCSTCGSACSGCSGCGGCGGG